MSGVAVVFLVFSFLLSSSSPISSAVDGKASPTAYEVLESFGFPAGLLPEGIVGYDLDRSTGVFRAYLNGTCSFSLEGSYQLRYQSKIGGRIAKDRLTDLSGISVKVVVFWLNIGEVSRYGDDLEFSVGVASADFPVSNFNVSPRCGCGLKCYSDDRDNQQAINSRPLGSSV